MRFALVTVATIAMLFAIDAVRSSGVGHHEGARQRMTAPRELGSPPPRRVGFPFSQPADARPSARADMPPLPTPGDDVQDPVGAGSFSPAALDSLDEAVLPTPHGLYLRTAALWSDPGFQDLTAEEARELFPIDDDMPFSGPSRLADVLGGLPTEEDCDRACADPTVRRVLEDACAAELLLYQCELAQRPRPECDRARQRYLAEESALMEILDRTTSFHSWRLWQRVFAEWSQ